MQVTLYSGFGKRNNSTKTPTTGGVTYTGTLKDNCTILNLSLSFRLPGRLIISLPDILQSIIMLILMILRDFIL